MHLIPFLLTLLPATYAAQDLNCNSIDVVDERLVSLTDPRCADHVDPVTGAPYESADYYYDYATYGCWYFVIDWGVDLDGDLMGGGEIDIIGADGLPEVVVTLSCDNCPEISNPHQRDYNGDGRGDECDEVPDDSGDTEDTEASGDTEDTEAATTPRPRRKATAVVHRKLLVPHQDSGHSW